MSMENNIKKHPKIGLNIDEKAGNGEERDYYKITQNYVTAISEAGGLPILIPPVKETELLRAWVSFLDGMVFTGGADYPPSLYGQVKQPDSKNYVAKCRAQSDMQLAEIVFNETAIPVLGICLGHQLINIANGGQLIQHLDNAQDHTKLNCTEDSYHMVDILSQSCLYDLFCSKSIEVNSSHHQGVDPDAFGDGLRPIAWDECGMIEGIEGCDPDRFALGVQWHPERIRNPDHRSSIFSAFINVCRGANFGD